MTTTTKKETGKGQQTAEALSGEWEDAGKASSGESDSPQWAPHLVTFAPDVITEKLSTMPEGSHTKGVLVGTLNVQKAFAELRYFVDEDGGKRIALPLHGALTSTLDNVNLTTKPRVRLEYKGRAKRSKPGQQAAFLYDVRVLPKTSILAAPRDEKDAVAPALLPIHRENKKKQEQAKRDAEDGDDE